MSDYAIAFGLGGPTIINETPQSTMTEDNDKSSCSVVQETSVPFGSNGIDEEPLKYDNASKECKSPGAANAGLANSANESPKSSHDTSNLSTCSDWFNTTREEMILYEKFGEEYDVIVEKMSKEEKIKLREEVSKATPKDARELLGTNDMLPDQQDIRQPSSTSNSDIKVFC